MSIDKQMLVEISEYKKKRTIPQNALYFAWLTDCRNTTVNEYAGNSVEYWHDYFKKKFLINLYSSWYDDIRELMNSILEVKGNGMESEYQLMLDFVVSNISTTRMDIPKFNEYLNLIESDCWQMGITLRTDI